MRQNISERDGKGIKHNQLSGRKLQYSPHVALLEHVSHKLVALVYVFLVRNLPARTCQFYTAESALKLRLLSSQLASSLGTQASMGWSDHKQKRILIKQSSHLQELLFVLRNLLGGLLGVLSQAHVVQTLALVLEGAQGGDLLRVAGLHVLQPLLVCIVLYEKRVNIWIEIRYF